MSSRPLVLVLVGSPEEAQALCRRLSYSVDAEAVSVIMVEDAVVLAVAASPMAVLIEVGPSLDGVGVATSIRARTHGRQSPVLIAMTSTRLLATTERSGLFDHSLVKPVDIEQLVALLLRD